MRMEKYQTGLNSTEIAVFFDGNFWSWSYTSACGDEVITHDSCVKYTDQITAMSEGFRHFNRMATAAVMIKLITDLVSAGSINNREGMNLERSMDLYIKKNF